MGLKSIRQRTRQRAAERAAGGEPLQTSAGFGDVVPERNFSAEGGSQPMTPSLGAPTPEAKPELIGTFADVKTGKPRGISLPGGRTFFGLNAEDIALLKQQQAGKTEQEQLSGSQAIGTPGGTIAQAAAERERLAGFQQLPREQLAFQPLPAGFPLTPAAKAAFNASIMLKKIKEGKGTFEEAAMLGLTPLDIQNLQAGKANVSFLGKLAEAIPIIGKKRFGPTGGLKFSISDFAGETPSEQVDALLTQLKNLDGSLETDLLLAQTNPLLMNDYIADVKEAEQNALELQSRIKLLFIQSPSLQANPDNVDIIMGQIDDTLDKIELRKLRAGIQ